MKLSSYLANRMAAYKIAFLQTCIILCCCSFAVAQDPAATTVKGKVTDPETNAPMTGVSVIVKGTKTGVFTDVSGNFSITAAPKDILVFSYVGYKPMEVAVGSQTSIDVKLSAATGSLSEVVVTALNQKREKRGLGYSVTNRSGRSIYRSTRN